MSNSLRFCLHFVGFRDDRYWNAVKVWGVPDFFHIGWDRRARREIADGDIVVFADGPADQSGIMALLHLGALT